MRNNYRRILQTAAVESAQLATYGKVGSIPPNGNREVGLGPEERAYIADRDSFYWATVSESGWPYLQHRGGAKGFLKVVDERHLCFADLEGNRQLFSAGNLAANDRVSLFLMDYRARERLKIVGRARVLNEEDREDLGAVVGELGQTSARVFLIEVLGFDWNCPKYITQRFTREEVEQVTRPMAQRIEELQLEIETLRKANSA